jgi:uncharacterized protein (TIGR01777 family)
VKVLVSGSSGLIGSAVTAVLNADGHGVARLVRAEPPAGQAAVRWDPDSGRLDAVALEGFDAVIHLAGEGIAGRWTAHKKARIRGSRIDGTRLLCQRLAEVTAKPQVLVSASAIGFYGNRGDEELDEESPPGSGFMPEVCRDWETATEPAARSGIRVVNARIGMVLSAGGGALPKMLGPFRLGLGGRLGSGRQWMSWIALDDLTRAILHAIQTEGLSGPVNCVAPAPVTNAEFTRTLGRVLRRPTLLPAPALALRLLLGQIADEVLLCSARVLPRRLLDSGFEFGDPRLEPALQRLLCWDSGK